jgi:dynein light intermediate chain, axonemal
VSSIADDVSFIIIRMASVEEGFLVYDAEWVEVSEEELLRNGEVYKKTSIFNPIKASSLDPKDPDLLNKMFEPYVFETEGKFYRLNVSRAETSRTELEELEKSFQAKLVEKQARKSGICPIREEIHNELFDEIIRQATVNLPERGILLMRVRDNLKMTFAAYQTLYEGSLVFGNRKAHVAELGISDLESKIEKMRKKKIELENQVLLR